MANVRMQVSSIVKLGLWEKVCDYHGWNPYLLNEGRINDNEFVEFDDEFKKEKPKTIYYVSRTDQHHEFRIQSDHKFSVGDVIEVNDISLRIEGLDENENELYVVQTNVYRVYQM